MSRFSEGMYRHARSSSHGMVTGEPDASIRHTGNEVHERASRAAWPTRESDTVMRLRAGRLPSRDRPGGAGPVDARRQPDHAAPAHAAVSEVTVRPRMVVLEPGTIPKTPSGKLRRATSHALLG